MLLSMFGLRTARAMAGGETKGSVTAVKTCYWFKVNTKPVRTHFGDGARYPHIIHVSYQVAGQTYTAKRWVNWNRRCPVIGEKITVYYEESTPENYAIIL